MFDALRAIVLVWALIGSVRRRFGFGIAAALTLGYLVAAELSSISAAFDDAPKQIEAAILTIFIGPSALPCRGAGLLPLSGAIGAHSFVAATVGSLVGAAAFRVAFLRAAALRPESREAREWDWASRPFLGVAVIEAMVAVLHVTFVAIDR